jgi:hypothetical protein
MNRTIKTIVLAAFALPHAACLGDDTTGAGSQGLRPMKPLLPHLDTNVVVEDGAVPNRQVDLSMRNPLDGSWSETFDPGNGNPSVTLIHEILATGGGSIIVLDQDGSELCRLPGATTSYATGAALCDLPLHQ